MKLRLMAEGGDLLVEPAGEHFVVAVVDEQLDHHQVQISRVHLMELGAWATQASVPVGLSSAYAELATCNPALLADQLERDGGDFDLALARSLRRADPAQVHGLYRGLALHLLPALQRQRLHASMFSHERA